MELGGAVVLELYVFVVFYGIFVPFGAYLLIRAFFYVDREITKAVRRKAIRNRKKVQYESN